MAAAGCLVSSARSPAPRAAPNGETQRTAKLLPLLPLSLDAWQQPQRALHTTAPTPELQAAPISTSPHGVRLKGLVSRVRFASQLGNFLVLSLALPEPLLRAHLHQARAQFQHATTPGAAQQQPGVPPPRRRHVSMRDLAMGLPGSSDLGAGPSHPSSSSRALTSNRATSSAPVGPMRRRPRRLAAEVAAPELTVVCAALPGLPQPALLEDAEVELSGHWAMHRQHGKQHREGAWSQGLGEVKQAATPAHASHPTCVCLQAWSSAPRLCTAARWHQVCRMEG